jgi:hypothetical protein
LRVVGEMLDTDELDEIAERMREYALARHGEQSPASVMVQGGSKEMLRLTGDAYAAARVRTAMFNAALSWRPFTLD